MDQGTFGLLFCCSMFAFVWAAYWILSWYGRKLEFILNNIQHDLSIGIIRGKLKIRYNMTNTHKIYLDGILVYNGNDWPVLWKVNRKCKRKIKKYTDTLYGIALENYNKDKSEREQKKRIEKLKNKEEKNKLNTLCKEWKPE